MVLDAVYKSKENETKGKVLKILTPKQMLQRLPIALGQVANSSWQIVYSLNQSKQIIKKVCNNIIKSINISV